MCLMSETNFLVRASVVMLRKNNLFISCLLSVEVAGMNDSDILQMLEIMKDAHNSDHLRY